jgi:kynurenine formamidase
MYELIDLTHTYRGSMPVYPGDSESRLFQVASVESDGYMDHRLETGIHVGTHMDAPAHMIAGGKFLHEYPVSKFTGKGVLVDARGESKITPALLGNKVVERNSVFLIMTGWDKNFGKDNYYQDHVVLSEEFASMMVEIGVGIVGLDTPSPDQEPFPIHKILLGNEVLIIENLTNLEALVGIDDFKIHAYPMKLAAEGAPVRVVAEVL